jgi:hypothetical protein
MTKAKRDKFGRCIKKDGTPYLKPVTDKFKSDEDKAKRAHREIGEEYADDVV